MPSMKNSKGYVDGEWAWVILAGNYLSIISLWFSRHFMAEILPIRRKTLSNQSINLFD